MQDWKWLLTTLYGLYVIWTGLWRGIEAVAYKPNALWFCTVMGILALVAAVCYRVDRRKLAAGLALVSAVIVLAFYLYCFIKQPEKDANVRVGLVIIAAIAEIMVVVMPNQTAVLKADSQPPK